MPSISISSSNVLPENLWVSAEFLLLSTGPTLDGTNRRPHPYQVLESLPALPVQGFPLLFSPKRMRSRPVHSIVSIRSFSRVGHGVGQAENTGRISCRMPVFSSCCFAQVTRVTSPTNRRSFFRRIIAGCQTADKHQIAALCRPYSLQWRRKIIDLLK